MVKPEKTDIALQKSIILLQKCRDMSLEYGEAKLLIELAVREYANQREESAQVLANRAAEVMMADIKTKRSDIACWRIKKAASIPPVTVDDGVRLWPMFLSGSQGGLTPMLDSATEYTGLVGELEIQGGYSPQPYRTNMESFYYILQGEGAAFIEGHELAIRTGDWIFVPPNWSLIFQPLNAHATIRAFVFSSYLDRKTDELVPVGSDPLSQIKPAVPYGSSATEAMNALAATLCEAEHLRISPDIGNSLYREADFYIEVAQACFGSNDEGVQKYTALAIDKIKRFIDDTRRFDSYKSDISKLKANITTFAGEWLHEATSIDWFVFADANYMKPEWGRPITPYTQLIVEWEVPAGKAFMPHTHNTEEIYYQLSSVTGMKIGPFGTNKLIGDEEEFFLYPGDCLFIPPNTKHVARSVSIDYPLHAHAVGSYSDEVVWGEAAVY